MAKKTRVDPRKTDPLDRIKSFLQKKGINIKDIKDLLVSVNDNAWDIDSSLGYLNIMSRLSPEVWDKFTIKDPVVADTLYSDIDYKECKSSICKWFINIHNLSAKAGANIWKALPKKIRKQYEELYPNRTYLSEIKMIYSRQLEFLNVPESPRRGPLDYI